MTFNIVVISLRFSEGILNISSWVKEFRCIQVDWENMGNSNSGSQTGLRIFHNCTKRMLNNCIDICLLSELQFLFLNLLEHKVYGSRWSIAKLTAVGLTKGS